MKNANKEGMMQMPMMMPMMGMNNMMPMMGGMMPNMMPNMMPMMMPMMCMMECEMTSTGMKCTMKPMKGVDMKMFKECCDKMMEMMKMGCPMMMGCGPMQMMCCPA